MVKKLVFIFVSIIFISACQQVSLEDNKNIQEGNMELYGKGENWEAEAKVKTKASVIQGTNSVTIKPLDSKGEINVRSNIIYSDDVEVEYYLERFRAKGKETLLKGDTTLTFLFEGGFPYSEESEYELTIKWIEDGVEKEEKIFLN